MTEALKQNRTDRKMYNKYKYANASNSTYISATLERATYGCQNSGKRSYNSGKWSNIYFFGGQHNYLVKCSKVGNNVELLPISQIPTDRALLYCWFRPLICLETVSNHYLISRHLNIVTARPVNTVDYIQGKGYEPINIHTALCITIFNLVIKSYKAHNKQKVVESQER